MKKVFSLYFFFILPIIFSLFGCDSDSGNDAFFSNRVVFVSPSGNNPPPEPVIKPVVLSINPTFGGINGGTAVSIFGSNFVSGAQVFFGLQQASNVQVVDASLITCQSPPGNTGETVDVRVENPDGTSGVLLDAFTYNNINVTGNLSFERVPHFPNGGLDYSNIQVRPIRNVIVQLLDASDVLLAQTVSDDLGNYIFSFTGIAPPQVKVRVSAEIQDPAPVRIVDENLGDALYVSESPLTSPLTNNFNFLATTGFVTGVGYSGTRLAAPFAILDTILTTLQVVVATRPNLQSLFIGTPLVVNWSPNNPSGAFFSSITKRIYLSGEENVSTREFDETVIVHEWAHYLQDVIGRADNIGGTHAIGESKDMRLAFNEGYGNALTGMILAPNNIYAASSGPLQSTGFTLNLESVLPAEDPIPGWFSEISIMQLIYDLFDSASDGSDNVSLGLGPILDVLEADVNNQVFISIFSFLSLLKNNDPSTAASIDVLSSNFGISPVIDEFAIGETNDGGFPGNLPVYNTQTINGIPVIITLGVEASGSAIFNQSFANKYITFIGNGNTVTITSLVSDTSDIDLFVFETGIPVASATTGSGNEIVSFPTTSGQRYVLNVQVGFPQFFNTPFTAIITITG